MQKAYDNLKKYFKEIGLLQSISTLAQWDNDVTMPVGGSILRQEQMMLLSGKIYQKLNNPKIAELIDKSENENLDDWQLANIRKIKRQYLHNQALDKNLVEATTKATLECEINWRSARKNNDFKLFAKYFAPLLKLIKETSQRKAELLKLSPYDALMDSYDEGRKSAEIDIIFNDLENFLPNFVKQVQEKQKSRKILPLSQDFTEDRQLDLNLACIKALGFNLNNGRLDTSAHPFSCGLSPDDVRITTRYDQKNFLSSLFGTLHETGHGIYEQNLPNSNVLSFQPVAHACGMVIHESQSLFVERHIGETKEFFSWLKPSLIKAFGNHPEIASNNLYNIITRLSSSLIRIEADEVTYPAHIILRYKLEKAMLSGDLPIEELPAAWDEQLYKLLQIKPKNHSEGCLQDIHWAFGGFGYFPTYTLGAVFAAQIDNYLRKSIDVSNLIKSGNFLPIISWLNENIHSLGSKYSSDELIVRSTGSALDVNIFKNYLKDKYLAS